MKYNQLTIARHANRKRVGRGISAGGGKTAGRGTKGQGARKSTHRPDFAGGQTPIYMQLPKLRGFKSHKPATEEVYTGQLESIKKVVIDTKVLTDHKFITSPFVKVKLIVKGDLKSKKTVQVQVVSAGAKKMVEKAGGTIEIVPQLSRPKIKKQD